MQERDPFTKTELRIEHISLQGANLNEIAAVAAGIVGIDRTDVLVTDVISNTLTLDILEEKVDARKLVGKKQELLAGLSRLPGITITENTSICSRGMLSWIALDRGGATAALDRSQVIAEQVRSKLSKRAIIFSTGSEVARGQVKDTNTPSICERLEAEGYSVTPGPSLEDDKSLIAAHLRQAVDDGYGLVMTTGGVGAEYKDQTIEAVLTLDGEAATPYISKYQQGTGRHYKDGVRIAAGSTDEALMVALPGPNDEVKASLDILVKGLSSGSSKHALATSIAGALRKKLQDKLNHRSPSQGHSPI